MKKETIIYMAVYGLMMSSASIASVQENEGEKTPVRRQNQLKAATANTTPFTRGILTEQFREQWEIEDKKSESVARKLFSENKEKYTDIIAKNEKEIDDLRELLANLRLKQSSSEEENSRLQTALDEQTEQVNHLKAQQIKSESESMDFQKKLTLLEKDLVRKQAEIVESQQSITQAEKAFEEEKNKLTSLLETEKAAKDQNAEEITALKKSVESRAIGLDLLKGQLTASRKDTLSLTQRMIEIENQASELKENLKLMEAQKKHAETQVKMYSDFLAAAALKVDGASKEPGKDEQKKTRTSISTGDNY